MSFAALALATLISAAGAADPPLAAAGYGQPEISADNCSNKDPGRTVCFLRPRTMGRYAIHVEGVSTATGPDATQKIAIFGADNSWACGEAETKKGGWSGGTRTLAADCGVTVLSDAPLEIDATFGGEQATLDPAGPVVTIKRMPWNGVLEVGHLQVGVKQAK